MNEIPPQRGPFTLGDTPAESQLRRAYLYDWFLGTDNWRAEDVRQYWITPLVQALDFALSSPNEVSWSCTFSPPYPNPESLEEEIRSFFHHLDVWNVWGARYDIHLHRHTAPDAIRIQLKYPDNLSELTTTEDRKKNPMKLGISISKIKLPSAS